MGLFDRLKKRRQKRETQTSTATSSASTSISAATPESSSYSREQEEAAKKAAALKAYQEEQARIAEQERLAAEAEAKAQAEREAAAKARQEAAALEAKMDAAKADSQTTTSTTETKTTSTTGVEESEELALAQAGLLSEPTLEPTTSGDTLATTSLTTFSTNLAEAVAIEPVKTEAELQAERDAAAAQRLAASTTTTSEPKEEPLLVTNVEVSSTTEDPILQETTELASLSEPTLMTLSEPTPELTSDPLATTTEPVTEDAGLYEGTTRLLDNIYAEPTTDTTATETTLLADSPSTEEVVATTLGEPTTETTEATLLAEPTAELTATTDTTTENVLATTEDAAAAVEEAVSYEPTSTVSSGFQLLTDGGTNTDPYAATDTTAIEGAIAGSGGTMESYNTLFDKYYADYFVDETLSPEEAEAFLASAPTTTLTDVRTETRSYEPSSKVQNLLEQGAQWMNPKGGMVYMPESEGYVIPPEMLALIAERRKLRQAEGLPVREEGKFWTLDADGNVIPKVFSQPLGYRGSTGVNAGPAGGAGKHGFFKGTRAQKRAIRRQYKKRGGKLLSSDKGVGWGVDFYDDKDDTWDVYGYDFPTATSPGSLVPKFYESTDRAQAQKVYDTWVKAYNVKYQGATPAQRATVRRQAAAKAGAAVSATQKRRQEIRKELKQKRQELRKSTQQGVKVANAKVNQKAQNAPRKQSAPNPAQVVANVGGGRATAQTANTRGAVMGMGALGFGGARQQAPRQQAPRQQSLMPRALTQQAPRQQFNAQQQLKNLGGNNYGMARQTNRRKVGMSKVW